MNDTPDDTKLPVLVSGGVIRPIVPTSIEEAWRIAKAVVIAGMNPPGLKTAEQCMIVIMHGLEVGMPPMMALQSIALINGRPSIYGDGALGLVYASGKLQTMKEEVTGKDDSRVATCTVVRRGDPEPKIGRFSVADAKKASLWGKQGPWQQYPERMLQFRARSWALRDAFADVLKGLAIAEEQKDVPVAPAPPKPPVKNPQIEKRVLVPTPPKPPVKEPEPEEQEIIDADTGEVLSPSELLTELDEALATAANPAQVEEIWNDYDIPARLAEVPQGLEFQGIARGILHRHQKRFE